MTIDAPLVAAAVVARGIPAPPPARTDPEGSPFMGRFNRKQQPKGYQPTNEEISSAARKLNAGSHHDAWDLTLHSGDYRQQTAMRILGASIDDAGEET